MNRAQRRVSALPIVSCRDPLIAFKNFAAGSTGASSIKGNATAASTGNGTVHAKLADDRGDAGNYAWFLTPDAPKIGIQTRAPNADTFDRYQQCLEACDFDRTCAAISVAQVLDTNTADNPVGNTGYNNEGPKSCMLVRGITSPGTNKRSVVHAVTGSVIIPTWTKGAHARVWHVCNCRMPRPNHHPEALFSEAVVSHCCLPSSPCH